MPTFRHVAGDLERKSRFACTGPAADHEKVSGRQAEVSVKDGKSSEYVAGLLVQVSHVIVRQLADGLKIRLAAVKGQGFAHLGI